MRKSTVLIALTAIALPLTVAPARDKLTGEQQLAKMLDGRVAGKPVRCISTFGTVSTTIIDKTAIVYESGSVFYVNRPKFADSLGSDDVMVTRLTSSELCDIDIVQLHERTGMWFKGSVSLSEFVPYTKVKTPKAG